MKEIRLSDLANLAIGTPEVGSVNFPALRDLLHAILNHLHIQDVGAEPPEEGTRGYPPSRGVLVNTKEAEPPGEGIGGYPPSRGVLVNTKEAEPPGEGIGGYPPSRGVLEKIEEAEPPGEGTRGHQPSGGVLEKIEEDIMERRVLHMAGQLKTFNNLPSGSELIKRSKSEQQGGGRAVEDMWQMMKLRRRMEVNEEGVSKAMAVLQDLMLEISTLKVSQRDVQDQVQRVAENLQQPSHAELKTDTEKDVEMLQKELELLKSRQKDLEDKMEMLCGSLERRPETKDAKPPSSLPPWDIDLSPMYVREQRYAPFPCHQDTQPSSSLPPWDVDLSPMYGRAQLTKISVPDGPILSTSQATLSPAQGSGQPKDSALPVDTQHVTQDGASGDTKLEVSEQQHATDQTLPEASMTADSMGGIDAAAAPGSPGETFALPPGATSTEDAMSTRTDALGEDKADSTEPGLLQTNTDDLAQTVPDLQDKRTPPSPEMEEHRGDKLEQMETAMDPIVTQQNGQQMEESSLISQQLGYLSASIQTIEKELKELRDRQEQEKATMEQSMADKSLQLQEQLDTLRGILTAMASSSSTLLAMTIPRESDSPAPGSTVNAETTQAAQGTTTMTTTTSKEHVACPACTIDIGKKVSKLVNQYEDLQKLVTDYTTGEASGKDVQEGKASDHKIQDTDVIGYIKSVMGKLQEECEQLNKTTKTLIQDHEQKQEQIDRADKRALDSKVSYERFDATTEHLGKMMEDLLDKMNAHEQDWQRLLENINVEMQNKLDRIEIDPLKNILEERWKDLCHQLQKQPQQYEADEAAGIRKQLMTRFHCLSCDRPVDMMVPGPAITTLPKIPGLPAHQSNRPYTVFELDRARQQSNRLKQARCEASQSDMSINHLRRIHSHMCQEISRVQLHYGGSKKTSKKISHLLQAPCVSVQRFSRKSCSRQTLDPLPQLGRSAYLSVPRSCGGSHTLTFSRRQKTKVKADTPCSVQKRDAPGTTLKEEASVLGQDRRLYQGQSNNLLPTTKPKASKSVSVTHQTPSGCNLMGRRSLSGSCSHIRNGVSKVQVVSTQGLEQPLPSITGTAPPATTQVTESIRRNSSILRHLSSHTGYRGR
ncbi:glutamine-rich protein 2-like isoform X2 [Dendropsophus ebraccatus]|uniref:glutamine-rich protein 2-like isoform X2 n=1 Tax=Dendropsophus ebraccatus TaxID=150705 RepID=UPI0038310522